MLANEQVLADGTCERSGDVVEKRDLEQWFFTHHRLRRRSCSTTSTTSTGPSGSRPCSATGSAAPRAPSSRWRSCDADGAPDGAPRSGVHHPARHQLRHDLLRAGARAPAGRRRSPPTSAGPRSTRSSSGSATRVRDRPPVDRGRRSTSGACSPAPTRSTRSPGSRCRSTSPTTC